MKFLDKLNLRRFAKTAAVVAIGGSLVFGGTAQVNAAPDGIAAFREAYMAQRVGQRMIDQDLTLISTNFHLDIDSKAKITDDGTMLMGGEMSWTYTNLKKNYSTNNKIPFFISQSGNEMTLYVERNGSWSKMLLPGLPSGIAALWRADDPATTYAIMQAVKNVDVIKDTPDMRIMNVTLDGQKVADVLEKNSQASFAGLTGDALTHQREIFQRWMTAVRANDITFAWTVNKPSWTTVTAAFDLTQIMQVYSRYVLDEAAAGRVVLTDEERDLLDAMGYYAELKSYTTYVSPRDDVLANLPMDLLAAPENDNSLDDIFYEMTTVVQK